MLDRPTVISRAQERNSQCTASFIAHIARSDTEWPTETPGKRKAGPQRTGFEGQD